MAPPDSFEYISETHPETHPARFGAVAKLFGLDVAEVETASILEIGCGHGVNLLALAAELPSARFLGVDISEAAITDAKKLADELALANIQFLQADFEELRNREERFDYIIAHGVYSWVLPQKQNALLEISSKLLNVNGAFYLSYNVYPGWHSRMLIREILLMETASLESRSKKVDHARGVLGALAFFWEKLDTPEAHSLVRQIEELKDYPDWFLAHDLLGEVNLPLQSSELHRTAERAGLTYVGDAEIWKMAPFDLSPDVAHLIRQGTENISAIEQRLDWARLETFRRAIFCRAGQELQHDAALLRLPQIRFSAQLQELPNRGGNFVFACGNRSEIETNDMVLSDVLRFLAKAWPSSVGYTELVEQVGIVRGPESSRREGVLLQGLFRCILSGQVLPWNSSGNFAEKVSQTPRAFPLSRMLAKRSNRVPSGLHQMVELDQVSRELLLLLTGASTQAAILSDWSKALSAEQSPARLEEEMETLLKKFHQLGLLKAEEKIS